MNLVRRPALFNPLSPLIGALRRPVSREQFIFEGCWQNIFQFYSTRYLLGGNGSTPK